MKILKKSGTTLIKEEENVRIKHSQLGREQMKKKCKQLFKYEGTLSNLRGKSALNLLNLPPPPPLDLPEICKWGQIPTVPTICTK